MNKDEFRAWIKKCEGYNGFLYKDSLDITTIGWGRNIENNGISVDEAELMLTNDINRSVADLSQYSWYTSQPLNVKNALINMCFNMGITRLLTFHNMIIALNNKDYTRAASEALDSKWALQVGQRAKDVAIMMREGMNA